MIEQNMIYDTLKVYFDKGIAIHITKNNNEWLNGSIIELDKIFILLNEFKKGKMPVFFSEIKNIETYRLGVKE